MSKAEDAGKSFLAGVLAKISDPEKRAQAEAAFTDPSAADALVAIGAGALAQSDINRRYDDLQTKEATLAEDYSKLTAWHDQRKADLEELDRLRATPSVRPITAPAVDTSKFVSVDDFNRSMNETQRSAANYLALQTSLTLAHYKDFNEVLDTAELLADPNLGKADRTGRIYGLADAYRTKYADQLTARDTARRDQEINKLVDEKVSERMKTVGSLPMPIRGGGSPLDALDAAGDAGSQYSAEAAALEYARLQQTRQTA
jgi:hypothetical protein